mgnify:CR=1 FL=1
MPALLADEIPRVIIDHRISVNIGYDMHRRSNYDVST